MGAEKDIPVLKPEVLMALPNEPQPNIDAASVKMFEETNKSIVKINLSNGRTSSGFVVDDGAHILTTAHNIGDSKEQFAIGHDGKKYKLEIEKMDDLNNLAMMRIKNGSIPGAKALTLGSTDLVNSDDRVWSLSYPRTVDTRVPYISPGYIRGMELPINLLTSMDPELPEKLHHKMLSMDLEQGAEAGAFLMNPLIETKMHVEIGSGGAPLLNDKAQVIGITSMTNGRQPYNGETLAIPVEYAKGLITEKGKFEFKYKAMGADWAENYISDWKNDKFDAVTHTGLAAVLAGLAVKGAARFPLAAAGGAAGYGLVNLTRDANRFLSSTDSADSWKYGLSTLADIGTVGGAALSLAPRLRVAGLALAGASMVGHAATDFIQNRWVLDDRKRLEGNPHRPPFSLDNLLKH